MLWLQVHDVARMTKSTQLSEASVSSSHGLVSVFDVYCTHYRGNWPVRATVRGTSVIAGLRFIYKKFAACLKCSTTESSIVVVVLYCCYCQKG